MAKRYIKNIRTFNLLFYLIFCLHLPVFCQENIPAVTFKITSPPKEIELDSFYKKYASVNGIAVISSWRVPDSAFQAACRTIDFMTKGLPPEVQASLVKYKTKVGIMARYEGTTDIPEHAHLAKDTTINWDVRARGLGGTTESPLTTCAEENILCYQIDKYHAEDILIHEFAHSIHNIGILPVDTDFNQKLTKLRNSAIESGKYKNTYAITNIWEYWAEGVQDWFNVNAEVKTSDGKHNFLNTRDELKEYDPGLYNLLSKYFPDFKQCPSCHRAVNIYSNPEK